MKIRDLQFAKLFIGKGEWLPAEAIAAIMGKNLEMVNEGEPNTISDRGSTVSVSPQDSVVMFLHNLIYQCASPLMGEGVKKDAMSLTLLQQVYEYVYRNYDQEKQPHPVVLSFNKLSLPSFLIHDLIEPITGTLTVPRIVYADCPVTDAARWIESEKDLKTVRNVPESVFSGEPMLLVNSGVYNHAATMSHVLTLVLSANLGNDKAESFIAELLANDSCVEQITTVVKLLYGDVEVLFNFLTYLSADKQLAEIGKLRQTVEKDAFFKEQLMKIGGPAPFDAGTNKQWEQFSILMGLIEKQLDRARGSRFPATEHMRSHEDAKRKEQNEVAKSKGKKQLNMEELLELARSWYKHKAVIPGELHEKLLTQLRVWK